MDRIPIDQASQHDKRMGPIEVFQQREILPAGRFSFAEMVVRVHANLVKIRKKMNMTFRDAGKFSDTLSEADPHGRWHGRILQVGLINCDGFKNAKLYLQG